MPHGKKLMKVRHITISRTLSETSLMGDYCMEMIKPEDCLKYDVCKFADDPGCLEGCDFRLEVALRSASDNTAMLQLLDDIQTYFALDPSEKGLSFYDRSKRLYAVIAQQQHG